MKTNYKTALMALIIISMFLFSSCGLEEKETDRLEHNLKGRVMLMRQLFYEAHDSFGNIEKGEMDKDYYLDNDWIVVFNREGNYLLRKFNYEDDTLGILFGKNTYKYDNIGNLINLRLYHQLKRPRNNEEIEFILKEMTFFEYDNRNNRISKNKYCSDSIMINRAIYKYDDNNNMIEHSKYNYDGSLINRTINKYDIQNNKIEEVWRLEDNRFRIITRYNYDETGNKIEKINYNTNGSILSGYRYEYDVNNNKTEKHEFSTESGRTIRRKYIYNDDGKVTKIESLNSTFINRYDDKGNTIEVNYLNFDGSLIYNETFQYDYDKNGNWIKKNEFINTHPYLITERHITYHKVSYILLFFDLIDEIKHIYRQLDIAWYYILLIIALVVAIIVLDYKYRVS